jgi:hypothetical protein
METETEPKESRLSVVLGSAFWTGVILFFMVAFDRPGQPSMLERAYDSVASVASDAGDRLSHFSLCNCKE